MSRFGWFLLISSLVSMLHGQDLEVVRVATGLNRPLYATAPPGDSDRLFILEQRGDIRILDLKENTLLDQPFLDVPVSLTGNERGLLGMAFHPDYAQNGFFYLCYTRGTQGDTIISRFQVSDDPNLALIDSERELLNLPQPATNHNGGWLGFGPDGMLYIGLGDGGGAGDPFNSGQDILTVLGTILRLDVREDDTQPYYNIPPDNPLVDQLGDDRIWAWGLRNPWRCSFDRETGDFWIADVGQDNREEVNFQPANSMGGENYGWRIMEGELCFGETSLCFDPSFTDPIYTYDHGNSTTSGRSVTGGYVYRGPIAELQGHYFFADFVSSRIWSFRTDGTQVLDFTDWTDTFDPLSGSVANVASFAEDAMGNLYIISLGGDVFRVESTLPSITLDGPSTGEAGAYLTFTASTDEPIIQWDWDPGFASGLTINTPNLGIAFLEPGIYTVTAVGTIQGGSTATASVEVNISERTSPMPESVLSIEPMGGDGAYLSWLMPSPEPIYSFEVVQSSSSATIVANTLAAGYVSDGLVPGETYQYEIRALDDLGQVHGLMAGTYTLPANSRYHLRFPHVAQNAQWWTGLVIANPGEVETNIDFNVIGDNATVTTTDARLGEGDKTIGLASDFLTPDLIPGARWLDLVSDQPLVGFELFGQQSAIMSGMEVNGRTSRWGVLPNTDITGGYVGISLINISETETATVDFAGYDTNGDVVANTQFTIPPLGKRVGLVEDLFGDAWVESAQALAWHADQALTGFEIWGDHQTTFQSGMTTTHAGFLQGILPVVEADTRIRLFDTSGKLNRLTMNYYNDGGTLVLSTDNRLDPFAQVEFPIEFLFESGFRGWVHVVAEGTLQGYTDLFRPRGDGPLSEAVPMQAFEQTGTELVYSHTANPDQWTTEIVLVNGDDQVNTITFSAFDGFGVELGTVERTLPGRGRLVIFARDLFENLPSTVAYIRANAQLDGLAGHLLYYTNEGGGHIMGGSIVRPLSGSRQ